MKSTSSLTPRTLWPMLPLALLLCQCNPPPDEPEITPQYRSVEGVEPEEPSSGERGSIMITEINWAGSVDDQGNWDPDDVFIELQNRSARPLNLSHWRLIIEGDYVRTFRLPEMTTPLRPNGFFVIAAKADGAFGDAYDVALKDLKIGKTYTLIELRDADLRLQESAGSLTERHFTGGYDSYGARSMERVQLIFANQGNNSRSWHANGDLRGIDAIREGWRARTYATPGIANSADYSGSSFGGNLD